MEIERKFRITYLPPDALPSRIVHIRQGYLSIEEAGSEVRIRQSSDSCTLTVKSIGGLTRSETEIQLTSDQFETLWPATFGRRIEKTRSSYLLQDDNEATVDSYQGPLSGLLIAEVEFPSVGAAKKFNPPIWFGEEVTDNSLFKNRALAARSTPL